MQTATPKKAPVFRKTTESFTAGAQTLPQCYFVSSEVFAEEETEIFARQWVCVGHDSQLARPGDYFVQDVAGESLIVARDQKGAVRGFHNVCRHRGTRLCEEANGHCAAIQCPYHAWTYALDGRLVGAPHMDTVPGFDKGDYPLSRRQSWAMGRLYLCQSGEKAVTTGRGLRATDREVPPLEFAAPPPGPAD